MRLLLLRGETKIRILDLTPPRPDIASSPGVSFIRTDITSIQSVRNGLTLPFEEKKSGLTTPASTVIFHCAALIRFWERANYTFSVSHNVNVQGTANILAVAKKLPKAILIHTSTADAAMPSPKFLRLGWEWKRHPWNKVTVSDEDPLLSPSQGSEMCYTRSKIMAERLVVGSNGWNGLRTGVLRPGQ